MSMDAVFQALVLTSGSYNFGARQWALALHFVSESQHDSLVRRHSRLGCAEHTALVRPI